MMTMKQMFSNEKKKFHTCAVRQPIEKVIAGTTIIWIEFSSGHHRRYPWSVEEAFLTFRSIDCY